MAVSKMSQKGGRLSSELHLTNEATMTHHHLKLLSQIPDLTCNPHKMLISIICTKADGKYHKCALNQSTDLMLDKKLVLASRLASALRFASDCLRISALSFSSA